MARLGRSQPQSTRVYRPKVSAIPVDFAGTLVGAGTLTGALATFAQLSGAPSGSSSATGNLKTTILLFGAVTGIGSLDGALTIEPATAQVTLYYQEDDEPVATTTLDYALLEYADGNPLDSNFMTLLQKGTATTDSEGYFEVSTTAQVQGTVVYLVAILPDGDPTDQMVWTLELNQPTTFYINDPNRNSGSLTLHFPVFDVIPPTVNISVVSVSKISRVAGKDSTDVSFTVDEPCQAWKAKVVSSNGATHTQGTLIESGGAIVPATTVEFNITDDEFVAASAAEGTNIVKIFVQDSAGNWSV